MTAARVAAVVLALVAVAPGRAAAQDDPVDPYAQPTPPEPTPPEPTPPEPAPPEPAPLPTADDDIDDQVAQALHRRGLQLFERGDAASAKTLFAESLERSPRGTVSAESLRMLRACNQKLGVANRDDGRPGTAGAADPSGGGPDVPLDPYAGGGAAAGSGSATRPAEGGGEFLTGGRVALASAGLAGVLLGLAVGGPTEDEGNLSGGAVLGAAIGGAAGGLLGYYFTRDRELTAGQGAAIASGTVWGAINIGLLGDAITGVDSDTNDVWKFIGAGAVLGLGGGAFYALRVEPSEGDVAVTNSLGAYGMVAGLLLGVGMSPPESEAYSLNAFFGSTAGITAGILLAPHLEISRRRTLMVDLGAAAGVAASWVLLYPLVSDDSTNDDEQAVGVVSTLTLGGGAALAWFLTRGMDDDAPRESSSAAPRDPPPPPALVQRTAAGAWEAGVPFLRPLAAPSAPSGIGLDVVSGRF